MYEVERSALNRNPTFRDRHHRLPHAPLIASELLPEKSGSSSFQARGVPTPHPLHLFCNIIHLNIK